MLNDALQMEAFFLENLWKQRMSEKVSWPFLEKRDPRFKRKIKNPNVN